MAAHNRRHNDPKLDTGAHEAIGEAVDQALEGVATKAEALQMARDEVAAYHRDHCPARGLEKKFETLSAGLNDFTGEFKEFRGEIRGQLRLVMFGVPLLMTLCGMLVAGAWTLATRTNPAKHSAVEVKDAGAWVAAGTGSRYGLISVAQASE